MASHNGVLADRMSSYLKALVYNECPFSGGKADTPIALQMSLMTQSGHSDSTS